MATEKETVIFEVKIEDDGAVESIDSIRKSTRALTQERNALNLATEEGRKRAETLNRQIDENNKKIKENSSALEKQRQNVGNYTDSIKDAADQLNIAGVNVGALTEKISAGISPMAAAAGGVSALVGLYVSSAAGARDLDSAQTQLSTSFKVLTNDLAKLVGADGKGGGLLSSLAFELNRSLFGIESAVLGSISADAQQALKEIELAQLDAQQFAKDQLALAEEQRRIRDDDTKSNQERLQAAESIGQFIIARETELVSVQERRLEKLRVLLATDKDNLEIQKEIKQTEFEIADIREDSAGKLTEALNGIKTVQKAVRDEAIESNAAMGASAQEMISKTQTASDEGFAKDLERINAKTQAEIDASNLVIDTTTVEIDETERLKDEAAVRDAERVANQTKLDKISSDQRLATARALYVGLGQVFSAFGIKSKGIASALATANTFLGVTEILKSPTAPFIEPFASAVRAIQIATTIATGIGAVRQINSVSGFASGGLTGTRINPGMGTPINRSNGDNMLATVKTGEVILNQSQQARLGGASTFAKIGVPGFATGGVTGTFETASASSTASQNRIFANMMKAFKEQRIVLPLEEFDIKQETRTQIQETARVL